MNHAKLFFSPRIWITAEHAADVLAISIEKADQLLSRPDTKDLLIPVMEQAIQESLVRALQQMARIPHETVPVRRDAVVELPSLPTAQILSH